MKKVHASAFLKRAKDTLCLLAVLALSLAPTTASSLESGGPIIVVCDDFLPAGAVDANGKPLVQVSPNPFTEYFHIASAVDNPILSIQVLDAAGNIWVDTDWAASCAQVHTADWPTGQYIVNVKTKDICVSVRIVK